MKEIETITKQFNASQDFNKQLSSYLDKNLKFGDKSPKEWKQYFYVKLPSRIEFANLVEISAELFNKYQQASSFRDKETMQLTILEQSRIDKFHTAYQSVRDDHEKKFNKALAAKSCEVSANLAVKDLEDAISNQKVAKDFWKTTCDCLTELRKLLEMMGYALSNDARVSRDFNVFGGNKNEH